MPSLTIVPNSLHHFSPTRLGEEGWLRKDQSTTDLKDPHGLEESLPRSRKMSLRATKLQNSISAIKEMLYKAIASVVVHEFKESQEESRPQACVAMSDIMLLAFNDVLLKAHD